MIRNRLTFNKSKIYPDNSHIRWELDGKGFIGRTQIFDLMSNGRDDQDCIVRVLEPETDDCNVMSPIFWNVTEWSKQSKEQQFKNNHYHHGRQSAMQWAEDFLMKTVTKSLIIS